VLSRRAFVRLAALGAVASMAPLPAALAGGEWHAAVRAAQAEGRLSLLTWGTTWGGSGFPTVIQAFEREFPGITVDLVGESSARVWLQRLRQERRAGTYAFDLAIVQPEAALKDGAAEGMWAPIRALLFRSDVLDDTAWRGGLNTRFLDTSADLSFGWEYQVLHAYAVNADMVADGEITSALDLLHPKWTGKIISSDPRLGLGLRSAAAVARTWGTDVMRQLLIDQRLTFANTGRHLTEALARGEFPVALGVRPKALAALDEPQLAQKVRFLDLPDADYVATTPILYVDRAPHPAAARLFANWVLTRSGQELLASSLPTNSARLDVAPFALDGVASVGGQYYEADREANFAYTAETQQFVTAQLGRVRLVG
jgi:iron(III) transport system substrate-binding protein